MKKLFTALTAALMLGSLLTAPVSADVTEYKMGDVNMDGVIDSNDAQLVLADYLNVVLVRTPQRRVLTEEQIALGKVYPEVHQGSNGIAHELCSEDAQWILGYYAYTIANPDTELTDVVSWAKMKYPSLFEEPV